MSDTRKRTPRHVRRKAAMTRLHAELRIARRERDSLRAQVQTLRAAIGTDEDVEAYLQGLPWTPEAADLERTLVAGNIRTFHAWIKERAGEGNE